MRIVDLVGRRLLALGVWVAVLAVPVQPAHAEESPVGPDVAVRWPATGAFEGTTSRRLERRCGTPCAAPGWSWRASLPVWVPLVRGSVASGSVRVESGTRRRTLPWDWLGDVDVADTTSELDFFFVGGLEARKGRLAVGFEVEHAALGATLDWRVQGSTVDGALEATIARAWARYEVFCLPGQGRCPTLSLAPTLGTRLYAVQARAQGDLVDFDRSMTWVDATLGFDAQISWRNGLALGVAADARAFGTGSGNSWFAMAEGRWQFSRRLTLSLGWAWHAIEFSRGRGPGLFDLDLVLSGPRVALTLAF